MAARRSIPAVRARTMHEGLVSHAPGSADRGLTQSFSPVRQFQAKMQSRSMVSVSPICSDVARGRVWNQHGRTLHGLFPARCRLTMTASVSPRMCSSGLASFVGNALAAIGGYSVLTSISSLSTFDFGRPAMSSKSSSYDDRAVGSSTSRSEVGRLEDWRMTTKISCPGSMARSMKVPPPPSPKSRLGRMCSEAGVEEVGRWWSLMPEGSVG